MRKRRLATCLLILAFLTGGVAPVASAQTVPTAPDDDALWAAFTETFFPDIDEGGEGSADDALYERLALWRQNPLHLNAATRDDLLLMAVPAAVLLPVLFVRTRRAIALPLYLLLIAGAAAAAFLQ